MNESKNSAILMFISLILIIISLLIFFSCHFILGIYDTPKRLYFFGIGIVEIVSLIIDIIFSIGVILIFTVMIIMGILIIRFIP